MKGIKRYRDIPDHENAQLKKLKTSHPIPTPAVAGSANVDRDSLQFTTDHVARSIEDQLRVSPIVTSTGAELRTPCDVTIDFFLACLRPSGTIITTKGNVLRLLFFPGRDGAGQYGKRI